MDLLNEGRLRVYEAVRLQNAPHLVDASIGVRYMFEHRLGNTGIKCLIAEGQIVSVTNDVSSRPETGIAGDQAHIAHMQRRDPVPIDRAAHHDYVE